MKKILLSILFVAVAFGAAFSQVPASFNYQAVVRNSSGEIIANKTVSFRISLLQGSESGTVLYSEKHSLSTNDFGLVNLKIGKGTKLSGDFSPADWGEVIFTKIEIDPAGGNSFSHLATTKLSSVPFAIKAQTVVDDAVDDADADPANEIQKISISGTTLQLSKGGGTVTLPTSGGGSADNWGTQTVVSDATLTGEGTTANPLHVVADGDGDGSNEIQWLSISGNDLSISDGNTVALPGSPWEETSSKVEYRGNKTVYLGDGSSSSLKTKSALRPNPPKFQISTVAHTAIDVYNETSVYPALNIWNEEGTAAKFSSNSDKPVAIFENGSSGLAAEFRNAIKIHDGNESDGKVLTSDANGVASWQEPASGGSSLWTQSGDDVYRSSGKVGIGTSSPSNEIDIVGTTARLGLKASSTNAIIYLDRKTSSNHAYLLHRTNGFNKFYVGLLGDDDYRINSGASGTFKGLKVKTNGNVATSGNLSVTGKLEADEIFCNSNMDVSDDLTVGGSVTVTDGEIHNTSSGSANMLAYAYGFVKSDGTLRASSGNVSVSHISTGKYKVTLTGQTYNDDDFVAVFSHQYSKNSLGHGSSSGKIAVFITKNSDDSYVDVPFSFVVYKP